MSADLQTQRPMPFGESRFGALDALRGLAAMLVAIGHLGPLQGTTYYLAVDFFLVLSGFILTHSYFSRTRISLTHFVFRRWARMYPLHLLTMFAVLLIFWSYGKELNVSNILLHLAFVQNMGLGPGDLTLNIPSWTISVEFWINVGICFVFITLGFGVSRSSIIGIAIIGCCCFAVIANFTGHLLTNVHDYKGVLNSGLVRCLASFCFGVLTYYAYATTRGIKPTALLELTIAACFVAIMVLPITRTPFELLAPFFFMFVIWFYATSEGPIAHALSRAKYLGEISFSIYLLHYPIRTLFEFSFDYTVQDYSVIQFILQILLTIVLSVFVHKWFEMPIYRALKVAWTKKIN